MAMVGHDLVVQAKSGMGKTAVFVISTLNRVEKDKGLNCIVIVHTKELCDQVMKEYKRFAIHMKDINVMSVMGGVDIRTQRTQLKESPPHIVVGTPGRLAALAEDNSLDLSSVKMFVIDEVDKVLEKPGTPPRSARSDSQRAPQTCASRCSKCSSRRPRRSRRSCSPRRSTARSRRPSTSSSATYGCAPCHRPS